MMEFCRQYIGGEFLETFRARCDEVLGPGRSWGLVADPQDPKVNWEVRKRRIYSRRLVINRLFPRPIHERRPDSIESAIRISAYDSDVWPAKMPAAVFTAPHDTTERLP
jgi:hypothetical protein